LIAFATAAAISVEAFFYDDSSSFLVTDF